MYTPKTWAMNTYTANTATDLVVNPGGGITTIIKTLFISNPTAASIALQLQVVSSTGTLKATILASTGIASSASQNIDMGSAGLIGGDKLQIIGDVSGLHFYVWGAEG